MAGRRGRVPSCGILCDNIMRQYFWFPPRFSRHAALLVAFCTALFASAASHALTRTEIYQALAPYADRSEAGQAAAFQAALKTVLVRVTGARSVDEDAALAPLIANARRYVQQYRQAADGQIW